VVFVFIVTEFTCWVACCYCCCCCYL